MGSGQVVAGAGTGETTYAWLFASSTVRAIGHDLSAIVDVNALNESDKRLQRIGWVNEGIEVLQRRAVPEEGA